jgi:predicted transcriptional regulator
MAEYANLQQTDIGKVEKFDVQSMINKALIGILISKEIITEEEMLVILGNINRQQEIHLEQLIGQH